MAFFCVPFFDVPPVRGYGSEIPNAARIDARTPRLYGLQNLQGLEGLVCRLSG